MARTHPRSLLDEDPTTGTAYREAAERRFSAQGIESLVR
jgi:hypothetical protein